MSTISVRPAPAVRPARREPLAIQGALIRGPRPVWAALFLNLLAFSGLPTVLPIPGPVGQLITQGALAVALVLALLANPRGIVRPSLVLVLLTCLALVALVVAPHNEFLFGSVFRASRLTAFTLVLWLLTPWWGRSDFALLRAHLSCLRVVLYTVVIGVILSPGAAFSYGGRLSGALWPIPPTQVAHYAAVLLGCTVVLWFCGRMAGRTTLLTVVGGFAALAGTHTRTALLGLFIGLLVAAASLFVGHARVRRTSALIGFVVVLAGTTLGPFLREWALRGQSTQEAGQLTGRTKVWTAVFQLQRPPLQELFGSGLSNKSFNGLPIDSNWVATYLDQGWFGISIEVISLLTIILLAVTHPRGPRRAVALFLVAYILVASVTETGLGDASPYMLELVLAASLLAAPTKAASP
jgi:hypothetical protein